MNEGSAPLGAALSQNRLKAGAGDMDHERFRRLEKLFHEAQSAAGAERAALMEQLRSTEPDLEAELASLLEADANEAVQPRVETPAAETGLRFGPYETEAVLGRGGMGSVYLARRVDGQYEQKVALKVMGAHLAGEEFHKRFVAERQILAQLNHPHITRLLDGGMTADGHPYLVMEYVDGLPVDRYADEQHLGLRQRLELFLQVCEALSHAHQNLIVHRDLKPSNIMVDRTGQVKLLDFGTAKMLAQGGDYTMTGMALLTPRYASPEQLRRRPVTTLSDIYSLGIVLFELLDGRWPFGDASTEMAEYIRLVENRAPDPLGHRVDAAAAGARGTSAAQLRRELSGDLRYIVARAMREEPHARYASVDALADDVRCYLEHRPVSARAGTTVYRLRKYAARHRWGLAVAGVVLAVAAGGVVSTVQQKRVAERRFQDVRKLARYQMFDLYDQLSALPGTTRIRRSLVEQSTVYLDSLRRQATTDADLRAELAEGYLRLGDVSGNPTNPNLGLPDQARDYYEKGIELAAPLRTTAARRSYALLELYYGMMQSFRGQAKEGHERMERSIVTLRELIAADPGRADNYYCLGNALAGLGMQRQQSDGVVALSDQSSGYYEEARKNYEKAARLDPQNPMYPRAIASIYQRMSLIYGTVDPQRSILMSEKGIAILENLPLPMRHHAMVQKSLGSHYGNLAWSYGQLRRFPEAHRLLDRYGEIVRAFRTAEPEDRRAVYDTTDYHRTKGILYGYEGKRAEAVEQFKQAAALHEQLLRSGFDRNTQYLRAELARRISDHLAALGDTAAARRWAQDALTRMRSLVSQPDPQPTHLQETAYLLLTVNDASLRDAKEALRYSRQAAKLLPGDPGLLEVLAQALLANGELDEADAIVDGLLKQALARNAGARTQQVENLEDLRKQIEVRRKAARN